MFHRNAHSVDDTVVKLLKQSQRMIVLCTFRLVDFTLKLIVLEIGRRDGISNSLLVIHQTQNHTLITSYEGVIVVLF